MRASGSSFFPQLAERVTADRDEFRVGVLVPACERGQSVEGTEVPGEPVFGWAGRAPVAAEERVSQVWPTWPGAEPETNEVAGGQIDARMLKVDDRDVARRAGQPVAGLEV